MLIEFTDKNINCYINGALKFFSNEQPFEVTSTQWEMLSQAETVVDGHKIKVFQEKKAETPQPITKKKEKLDNANG